MKKILLKKICISMILLRLKSVFFLLKLEFYHEQLLTAYDVRMEMTIRISISKETRLTQNAH